MLEVETFWSEGTESATREEQNIHMYCTVDNKATGLNSKIIQKFNIK